MRFHKFALTGMTAIACCGLASEAVADGRNAGSLLLYPEFNNQVGSATVITITNVSTTTEVDVEFVYIDGSDCSEFNREETLTANDTLTVLAKNHNPQNDYGYMYAFAREGVGNPISHDYLIGNVMVIDGMNGDSGWSLEYSFNAVSFETDVADGGSTELTANGLRDLDGDEYHGAPAEIQVPHFWGQGGAFDADLILIGLSGGSKFETTVDFLVYNDNEVAFSTEYSFECWARTSLVSVSALFEEDFLEGSGQDEDENIHNHESGWFRMWGDIASSSSTDIEDPAVYGVLIENIYSFGAADLPWEEGVNLNGKLLARSLDGTF
jgi:hypothetical protein